MKNIKDIQADSPEVNISAYFGADSIEKAAELYESMQRPFLKGVDLGIELPVLGHWVKTFKGKNENNGPKRFSFTEYVWYKIVEQLRNAGLSFPIISELKTGILEPITVKGIITKLQQAKHYIDGLQLPKAEREQLIQFLASPDAKAVSDTATFTLLHVIIMESLLKKRPLSLAVFLDGTYIILDKTKEHLYTDTEKNKLLFDTHTVVSVSAILKRFIHADVSGFIIPAVGLLSYAENKLFEVVHSGEYESILIHFKDKKIKSLELTKSESVKERIIDILDKGAFGEIIVKKHKGIVTKIENTIKVTL